MSEVECICTCARARPVFQISQTAGQIAFNVLCVNRDPLEKSFTHVWGGVHLHVRTCTPRFPDLANGWADRVQCLCVNRDPLEKSFTHVWGGLRLHVRTCTPRFPDLANGWVDRVQILCVNRDPLDYCFTHVWGGVHLHVRTCTPLFHILQTAGRIAFKFCVWIGTQ